jgi:hypothetical protein
MPTHFVLCPSSRRTADCGSLKVDQIDVTGKSCFNEMYVTKVNFQKLYPCIQGR